MSIPQNSQPVIRTTPTDALPKAQSPAVSNPTGQRAENYRVDVNSFITSMVVKSVLNFVEVYRGKKNPNQEPVKQKSMLQTIYTEYKKPVNDMLTLLGGAAPASARPFVGAFKSILLGQAGNDSRMNGYKFNIYSGPVNALGGAVAGLLSSGLFYKGSTLKTGADILLKNIQSGIKNPNIASFFRFDASGVGKSMVAISMHTITSKLTENLVTHRPKDAGTQMTKSDEKYTNRLFVGMVYAYSMQALIGLPGIKEGLADFFIPKFKNEKAYDEILRMEATLDNTAELEILRAAKPAALNLAEQAKSVRIEIPQQIHQLTAVGILAIATYVLFNRADKENSGNYIRQHNNQ
jgi:hypothetical protein